MSLCFLSLRKGVKMPNQANIPEDMQQSFICAFYRALYKVYSNDSLLIKNKSCERSIVFRLGLYLAEYLRGRELDVDCEYNKEGENPKSLPQQKHNFPDLIVHERACSERNRLIVEVKTFNNSKTKGLEQDREKLIGFTQDERYRYKWGVHVYIAPTICYLVWYQQGEVAHCFELPMAGNNCTSERRKRKYRFFSWYNELRAKEPNMPGWRPWKG